MLVEMRADNNETCQSERFMAPPPYSNFLIGFPRWVIYTCTSVNATVKISTTGKPDT
jgi:hypothetical protein